MLGQHSTVDGFARSDVSSPKDLTQEACLIQPKQAPVPEARASSRGLHRLGSVAVPALDVKRGPKDRRTVQGPFSLMQGMYSSLP